MTAVKTSAASARRTLATLGAALLVISGCELLGLRWDVGWEREFQSHGQINASAMALAADGSVLAVGQQSGQDADALVICLDKKGREVARKTFGGPYPDYLECVSPIPTGGYIAGGNTSYYAWLLRLDESGDTIWTRTLGDSGDFAHFYAAVPTADGGFLAAGVSGVMGQGQQSLLLRIDAAGNEVWRREGYLPMYSPNSLLALPDGGFLISSPDSRIARTNADGDTTWTREYPVAILIDICSAPGGGFYAVGDSINQWPGAERIVTMRFNAAGETLWKRTFRDEDVQNCSHVVTAPDSGCVVFGTMGTILDGGQKSRALVLKYSPDGELKWKHVLGSDRSSCHAGAAGSDGWLTLAVNEDPVLAPEILNIVRTRP